MDYADLRHYDLEELEVELDRIVQVRWENIQAGHRRAADALTRRMLAVRHAIQKLKKDRRYAQR